MVVDEGQIFKYKTHLLQPAEVEDSLVKLNSLIASFDPQLFMSHRHESAKEWRRAANSSRWLTGISQLFAAADQVVAHLQASSPVVVMSQFGNDLVPHLVSLAQVLSPSPATLQSSPPYVLAR